MQDLKMTDQIAGHEIARHENNELVTGHEIAEQASFLSIWVGAKKKRPTTAECCLSINDQSS